jgi:putative transposase
MPRAKRILQSEFPYHVTSRTVNKENFRMELNKLWSLISLRLHFCSFAFGVEIHAFVLMRNHYHLIARTPNSNLSEFLCYFNRELSKEINRATGKINQTFGNRYYASIVKDPNYYLTLYRYVYRNPVEAKACKSVEDYEFSSLQNVLGNKKMEFPVFDYPIVDGQWLKNLEWLNSSYKTDEKAQIRRSLKRQIFEL